MRHHLLLRMMQLQFQLPPISLLHLQNHLPAIQHQWMRRRGMMTDLLQELQHYIVPIADPKMRGENPV
jgi:hypothetical protein